MVLPASYNANLLPPPGWTLMIHPVTNEPWFLKLNHAGGNSGDAIPAIDVSGISTFPQKQVQNDWTRADHEILSSYVQSDTTGGGQVYETDESVDASRFWFATASTEWPRQVALPRLTHHLTEVGGVPFTEAILPLADYDGLFWFAHGTELWSFDPLTDTAVFEDDFESGPRLTQAIVFRGLNAGTYMFIATAEGYEIWDGAALSGSINIGMYADALGPGDPPDDVLLYPLGFAEWDNKLYALGEDGKISEATTGVAGNWVIRATIDARYTPRHILDFYDRSDEPCLHVVCKEAVFALDIANGKAIKTKLRPPSHPNAGRSWAIYNTDLHVSYGLGVTKFTGASMIPDGLNRDWGLPKEYRGSIVSMTDTYNGYLALVTGRPAEAGVWPTFASDLTQHQVAFPSTASPSIIMFNNTNGWHTIWNSGTDVSVPTTIMVSNASDSYRVYWGFGSSLCYQDLSVDLFNPITRDEAWEFEEDAFIEYGDLDFAMTGYLKLLAAVEVRTKGLTADETIEILVSVDAGAWVSLGTISTQPLFEVTRLQLGVNGVMPDGVTPRYDGIAANSIRLRARLRRGSDTTKSPILESIGVVFHKLMSTLKGYTMTIDASQSYMTNSKTPGEIHQFLEDMLSIGLLIPWYHSGAWHSVRFAGLSGVDESGTNISGDRQISLLEVLAAV